MRRSIRDRGRLRRSVHNSTSRYSSDVYDPEAIPQYFQISVNVIEARKLRWSNTQAAASFVTVVLGGKRHRTTVQKNQDPCYTEYMIFDVFMSIREIQRLSLWLVVMEPRCYSPPRMLGETSIELVTVWNLPNHQMYHKWVQLSLPRGSNDEGPVGFLKVDVSILPRREVQVMPAIISANKVEDQVLLATGSEQQPARYLVTVHAGLLNSCQPCSDHRLGRGPSAYVRVTFCGIVGKTSTQKYSHDISYNEQISIVEVFPNTDQVIKLEVCLADMSFNRVIAGTEIRFGDVSHGGVNGFLPTFGPSLLHMYAALPTTASGSFLEDGPYHKGALLVSLKTIVPYYVQSLRTVSVEPAREITPDQLWAQEECFTYCSVFEISMLDKTIFNGSTGLAVTISGELPSERPVSEGAGKYHYTGVLNISDSKSANGSVDFFGCLPVLQCGSRLPDFRFRMYRNNIILRIVNNLENTITEVEKKLNHHEYENPSELIDELNKAVDDASGNILKFQDIVNYSSNSCSSEDSMPQYTTELDQSQLNLQKEEIEKVYNLILKKSKGEPSLTISRSESRSTRESVAGTRKAVKYLLADVKAVSENLKKIIFKTPDGWPDLVLWLVHDGSRVAYTKVKISEIIYSVIPEQCGLHCGRIQTLYMKPIKCSKHGNSKATCLCIAGKVELLLWTGLFRQRHAFGSCLPRGYRAKINNLDVNIEASTMMLECRTFIYRAKLINEEKSMTKPYNAFVRINALNCSKDSQVKIRTMMPVWNQVIKMKRLALGSIDMLYENPPYVLVEIFNDDFSGHPELLGRFQIQPVVEDRPGYAPKLEWYEIFKGSQRTGQIMMSVQLLPMPEEILKNTVYAPAHSIYPIDYQIHDDRGDELEVLPTELIPQAESFKADIFWWGLRDVNITKKPLVILEIDDLTIKSDIILSNKNNSNFPNGKVSQIFESPLSYDNSITLSIKLYDSCTFGRTLFLGTNIIKHPNKFIINWLPKREREASLKAVPVVSSDFCDVGGRKLYLKGKKPLESSDESSSSVSESSFSGNQYKTNKKSWSQLFKGISLKEEKLTLLPVYVKENNQIKVVKKMPKDDDFCGDWWNRYFLSAKMSSYEEVPSDYITIYDYELEHQPEFSKFKDWCSTFKLYNGQKTGIPERDEQLYCGSLKAGLVMYRWPPPKQTVAVAYNGIELERGYFADYPDNEPTKYIVRVYVVKGISLHKAASRKADPYVVVRCGKRELGDRNHHVSNNMNPIFGKMYEFICNFPDDYSMTISVYDYQLMPPDELIGSTTIDLEDRVYSRHRAGVGLAQEYTLSGPSKWRDKVKPSGILEELCSRNNMPPPAYPDTNTVIVNGVEYKDKIAGGDRKSGRKSTYATVRKENICLSILHKWHTLPLVGYHLVPEHVETRSLYHSDTPGFERGKIQLWVDLFPAEDNTWVPSPRNIAPRRIDEYELRVIVWDVQKVPAIQENNKYWKTADLFVKLWIGSIDNAQQTDVHYNSLSGEGNFNWRMVFNFFYNHAERKMIFREQCPFTEYQEYAPPILHVQVMEIKEDDILGVLSLDLNSMPRGSQYAQSDTDAMDKSKKINLFSMKSIRAWWPLETVDAMDNTVSGGVIDLEMTLLPRERAVLMPVGIGRAPPAPLPKPARRNTSFSGWPTPKFLASMASIKGETVFSWAVLGTVALFILSFCAYVALPVQSKTVTYTLRDVSLQPQRQAQGLLRSLYDFLQGT